MMLLFLLPLELFLPGYSWILCSGLDRRFGFLEKIALSFVVSVSFASLFTAGLSMLTSQYFLYSVFGSVMLSLVLLLTRILRHRGPLHLVMHIKSNRKIFVAVTTACAYVILLLLLGWSSPIYPSSDALDPITHAAIVDGIINGSGKVLLLHTTFPIGLHFASALLGRLLDLNGLGALRVLLAMVLIDSFLLTYFCAGAVLGQGSADFALLAAAFVVPVDAIHLIKIGTFPNVLSDLIVLAVLWLMFAYMREPNPALGLTLALLTLEGLFVHSTFIIFLTALWIALPVFFFKYKVHFRNYLMALLFATAGLFSLALVFRSFLTANFERIASYGVSGALFTPVPLTLQTILWNYYSFAGSLAPSLIIAAVIFVLLKRRNSSGSGFACVWFGILIIGAVVSTDSWRFVLLSMAPGSLLLGQLLSALRQTSKELSARTNWLKGSGLLAPLVLIALVLSGGFITLLPRVYDPAGRTRQQAIFASMSWLKQNDHGYSVVSVGLWSDYRYLYTLTGISYMGDYNESAPSIIAQSMNNGFRYVAVAIQSSQFPTFQYSSSVQEKYQNSIVAIFFILS